MKKLTKEKKVLEKKLKKIRRETFLLLLRQEQIKEEKVGFKKSLN